MPAQVTTRPQVNGYRFLLRRLEHALIRADSRMIHDPMRGQIRSLVVGMVIAILVTGAAGVLAFFKPNPNIGDAQILLSKSTGGIFVRINDQLHPVLNVASARLITAAPDQPKQVDDKWLNQIPRGPMVGIIGAPTSIHAGDDMSVSSWTVCDNLTLPDVARGGSSSLETAVLANVPVLGDDIRAAAPDEMVLARFDDTDYLIFDGVRAPIDLNDPVVVNALHLQGARTRVISPGLLNALPMVPAIRPVPIDGAGSPPAFGFDHPIGTLVRTVDSRGEQAYVVLRDGLQPISEATGDIIRYGAATDPGTPREVSPAVISQSPVVHELAVDHYPAVSPEIMSVHPDRVTCMAWQRANSADQATTRLLIGHRLPLPEGALPVQLATADGNGPGLDWAYLQPGSGEFVETTGIGEDSQAKGQLFYVSDTGLRYPIKDLPTAKALGVTGVPDADNGGERPQLAPWPVLSLLPAGPELSREAALVAHDGMAADPEGSPMEPSG